LSGNLKKINLILFLIILLKLICFGVLIILNEEINLFLLSIFGICLSDGIIQRILFFEFVDLNKNGKNKIIFVCFLFLIIL